MHKLLHRLLAFWLGLAWAGAFFGLALAGTEPANADKPVPASTQELVVYVRDGCPHCAEAKLFLAQVVRERPHLRVSLRPVDQDPKARDELIELSSSNDIWPPGVPTFSLAGRVLVGFGSVAESGPDLLDWIDQGAPQPPDQVKSTLFGTVNASQLGLPLFTLALGLLDGFNPCAMWVLLFLLSFLVRLQNRRRMALVAGTFVLVSGAVYYAFMAAWLNIFLAVGLSTPVRWALACLALLIGARGRWPTPSPCGRSCSSSSQRECRTGSCDNRHTQQDRYWWWDAPFRLRDASPACHGTLCIPPSGACLPGEKP